MSWGGKVAKGEHKVKWALLLLGMGVIIAQIVLLRELIRALAGNELAAGIMLSCWLFWTGIGSLCSGRWADRVKYKARAFSSLGIAISILLPIILLLLRLLRPLLGIPSGGVAPLPQMGMGVFVLLAPFCLASGALFPFGCALLAKGHFKGARGVGIVYIYEAIGAGLGGIAFSFVLIHTLTAWQITLLASLLLISAALLISRRLITLCLPLIALYLILFLFSTGLDLASQEWGWRGYRLIASKDTIYGNIAVITDGAQVSFIENGVWAFTHPDPQTAEEAIHLALLQHKSPRDLLLIGGGIGGLISEALKHPSLSHLVYVELDPNLIALGKSHLPGEAVSPLDDPRVEVIYTDGRRFLREGKNSYDAIILNLPDPTTAQLNRYYTEEFFCDVADRLREGGVFTLGLHASEDVIGPTLAEFLGSIYATMRRVFLDLLPLPGGTVRFIAGKKNSITADPETLLRRARERGLKLYYVREYYLHANLSTDRVGYLKSLLEKQGGEINKDLRPICYYYDTVLWSAQHAPFLKGVFLWLQKVPVAYALLLLIGIAIPVCVGGLRSNTLPLLWSVWVTGLSGISLEVILIFCFQIFYGYLYYAIGLIITSYMIGLAIGAHLVAPILSEIKRPMRLLCIIQGVMALYSAILLVIIILLAASSFNPLATKAMEKTFPMLTLIAGILGGMHFPVANRAYLRGEGRVGSAGGATYGVDLIGAASGPLMISVIVVPIAGIANALTLIVVLNLLATIPLMIAAIAGGEARS